MNTDPQALGALANAHQLLLQLAEGLSTHDCARRVDPALPSIGWLLGHAVYLELDLLRGQIIGDDDLAGRVRHLFAHRHRPPATVDAQLPPRDHLLNWASQALDQHLGWLANPQQLPDHPLLADGRIIAELVDSHALSYERMLAILSLRNATSTDRRYRVGEPLKPATPVADTRRIEQGHYRIGGRNSNGQAAREPAQLVELHAFRIGRRPVSNAEYLAFMVDGGYQDPSWWDAPGWRWRQQDDHAGPWSWRRDRDGHWYGLGINGPIDLLANEPVTGLCRHEAKAFAAWADTHGDGMRGAVVQHEYQWEVAARLGELEQTGLAWEWCANPYHRYADQQAAPGGMPERCNDDDGILRGAGRHSQPVLRRTTLRHCAPADDRALFAGTRLVLPPGQAAWE